MTDEITIRGARLHNLKNVTLSIPKGKLVVLTGISGSGKSTLAFDILHKEGLRQYFESIGMVTFGLAKAPVSSIVGLSPTISIDQRLTNHSPRSTVGTSTEVYTYLRVLYARVGRRPCPHCGADIAPLFDLSADSDVEWEGESDADESVPAAEETFPCPHCGLPVSEIGMEHFSFN
ncbi:MAG TPA: ATP-binding cassette domain-containing protein, partial [Ktedonobacterales bacterium]